MELITPNTCMAKQLTYWKKRKSFRCSHSSRASFL